MSENMIFDDVPNLTKDELKNVFFDLNKEIAKLIEQNISMIEDLKVFFICKDSSFTQSIDLYVSRLESFNQILFDDLQKL